MASVPLLHANGGNDGEVLGEGAVGEDGVRRHRDLRLSLHRIGQPRGVVIIS